MFKSDKPHVALLILSIAFIYHFVALVPVGFIVIFVNPHVPLVVTVILLWLHAGGAIPVLLISVLPIMHSLCSLGLVRGEKFSFIVCTIYRYAFRILSGYELRGLENLPSGQFMIAGYHAKNLTADAFPLYAELSLRGWTNISIIFQKKFRDIRLFNCIYENIHFAPTGRQACKDEILAGKSILVFPGGHQESCIADDTYRISWPEHHIGFAKVAIETGLPIIPMFSKNINEVGYNRAFLREYRFLPKIMGSTLPLGYFPVKVITYLGRPVNPSDFKDASELALAVRKQVEKLRDDHQPLPGSIIRALWERVKPPSD